MTTIALNENFITQEAKIVSDSNIFKTFERQCYAGIWSEWSAKQLEITTGIEFETNEIRNGKVVYGKIIDFGILPNQSQKSVPHNIENLNKLIDGNIAIDTQTGAQYVLPLGRRIFFIQHWQYICLH